MVIAVESRVTPRVKLSLLRVIKFKLNQTGQQYAILIKREKKLFMSRTILCKHEEVDAGEFHFVHSGLEVFGCYLGQIREKYFRHILH